MENLQGKCVLLCVTGGIAAYKMPNVASALRKAGADVHVVMTENATQFITPLTFESLTNNRCVVDTFARDFQYDVRHISLAKAADLILSQGAETFHFGSRFWLLFVIIAILHCLGRRREKKQAAARKASVQPGGPDETPEVPASPENSDENREA